MKQKPVWRVNSGNGVPSDWKARGAVMYFNGAIQEGYKSYTWNLDKDFCAPIAAYETTRTKPAKYERVECDECQGKGKWKENYWFTRVCGGCNSKGYILKEINHAN